MKMEKLCKMDDDGEDDYVHILSSQTNIFTSFEIWVTHSHRVQNTQESKGTKKIYTSSFHFPFSQTN